MGEVGGLSEVLAEVLKAHRIECTGVGEVTCRGCRELRWMTWADYHAHVAAEQADVLAERPTDGADDLGGLAPEDEWMRPHVLNDLEDGAGT